MSSSPDELDFKRGSNVARFEVIPSLRRWLDTSACYVDGLVMSSDQFLGYFGGFLSQQNCHFQGRLCLRASNASTIPATILARWGILFWEGLAGRWQSWADAPMSTKERCFAESLRSSCIYARRAAVESFPFLFQVTQIQIDALQTGNVGLMRWQYLAALHYATGTATRISREPHSDLGK